MQNPNQIKSFISVVQVNDPESTSPKRVYSSISRDSFGSNDQVFYYEDKNNNSMIKSKVTKNEESKQKNIVKTTYSSDGGKSVEAKVEPILKQPEFIQIDENRFEEIFYSKDGENDVKTRIINQRNEDGSIDRTHIITTYFSNGEFKTEGFVETIYDDNNTSSSNWSLEQEDLNKKKYERIYSLKGDQYDLMRNYFKNLDNEGFINKTEFRNHIILQVKDRLNIVRVTEKQIDNAIDSIDFNKSGDIDFDQFLEFLCLFFSSKYNIKRKIVSVLTGRSNLHEENGKKNLVLKPEKML